MKIIFTFLITILPFITHATEVSFFGKIKNTTAESVDIELVGNDLSQEKLIYRAKLNEQNEFSILLKIQQPQVIRIKLKEKVLHLFASPKTLRLEFEFDSNAPNTTLILKGDNIANNSFYNSFTSSFQWNPEKWESYELGGLKTLVTPDVKRMATSYSIYDYFKIIDRSRSEQLRYLQTSKNLGIDCYKFIENEINWRYETNKIAYFLLNKNRFSVSDLSTFWVRYSILQNANLNDDKAVSSSAYQNMLNAFIHFLHLQTPVETKISESYYTFISNNLQGKPRYFMLAKLMVDNYRNAGNTNLASQKLKAYKRENPYQEYSSTLDNIFGKDMEFLHSKNAPNMKVMDLNENEVWLNEYTGRVVYVSFWASWCVPCIKGFKESAAFRKEMEQQGVVFLNVNLDDREDIWRKALSKYDIIGKNVYGLDLKQAKTELKIAALPYYFLMDKYGKIAYLSSNKLVECREDFIQFLNN